MNDKSYAVITGDVVNSSRVPVEEWLPVLNATLKLFGKCPAEWEIFRGDSFQLLLDEPEKVLLVALEIKASLKQINETLDARIAISLGDVDYIAEQISQSNGPAFINAGKLFDQLGKTRFAVDSTDAIHIMVDMAQLVIDNWTSLEAETFLAKMRQPTISQVKLAKILNTTQSRISERLKRSGYEEIQRIAAYFERLQNPDNKDTY